MTQEKLYPSDSPVWVIELDKGQLLPARADFILLAFLRIQVARNATKDGIVTWRLRQAHLELQGAGCRFQEGGFAFDYDADGPTPFTTSFKRDASMSGGVSGTAGGGVSPISSSVWVKGKLSGDKQRKSSASSEMSMAREFRPIALVQSSPNPKWILRARPEFALNDENHDFDSPLEGRYRFGETFPIAQGICEAAEVTITPLLTFRPSDVVLDPKAQTGLWEKVTKHLTRKPDRTKKSIIDILMKQSVFRDDYSDEIGLEGPVLTFQVPDPEEND